MVHDRCNYFSFCAIFCPFLPPNSPKNQHLKKMKTTPGDIIILHTCTKNYDQMMYGSWTWCTTDRQMEKVTYRGRWVPHLKILSTKFLFMFIVLLFA